MPTPPRTPIHISLAQQGPWPCLGGRYLVGFPRDFRMGVILKAQFRAPVPSGYGRGCSTDRPLAHPGGPVPGAHRHTY